MQSVAWPRLRPSIGRCARFHAPIDIIRLARRGIFDGGRESRDAIVEGRQVADWVRLTRITGNGQGLAAAAAIVEHLALA